MARYEKLVCDLCGAEIDKTLYWYSFKIHTSLYNNKYDLCKDCVNALKQMSKDMQAKRNGV